MKLTKNRGRLVQHNLSAGDWQGLSCLIGLFHQIVDGPDNILTGAASVHGNLCLIEFLYVCNGGGSRYLAGTQVLDKKPFLRVRPQGAVKEVAGANGVHLDAIFHQLQLKGLDGRILKVRSAHAALNVLLQSAGAVVMKQYLVMLDEKLQKEFKVGIDYEFVANIHDEVQIQVKEEYAQKVAHICVETFKDVTDFFKFRIRLDGEAKIGNNWKETH